MLRKESEWYREVIETRVRSNSLVLNIGSSTKYVAEVRQPYIQKNVLDALAEKHCVIKNVDIKESEGVDIVGDISNPSFAAELRALEPDVIICANTLEHIENREIFSKSLASLLGDQTLLIISAPHTFPYHADPIDTMYRTDVAGLAREFPSLQLIEGTVLTMPYYSVIAHRYSFAGRIKLVITSGAKCLLKADANSCWLFRNVYETCALFKVQKNKQI